MKIVVQIANTIRPKTRPAKTWGARLAIMEVWKEVSKAKEGERKELKVREVKKENKPKNDNKTGCCTKKKYTACHIDNGDAEIENRGARRKQIQ